MFGWFKRKTKLALTDRNDIRYDQGGIESRTEIDGKSYFTSCSKCNSRVHIVIKNDNDRALACPVCCVFIKPDPEEANLENMFKKAGLEGDNS